MGVGRAELWGGGGPSSLKNPVQGPPKGMHVHIGIFKLKKVGLGFPCRPPIKISHFIHGPLG